MSNRTIIAVVILLLILGVVVWFAKSNKDEAVTEAPVLSVSAHNQTKDANAVSTPAEAQNVIVYTLSAENQTDKIIAGYIMEVNISEVTNKATLIDAQGASYNSGTSSLVWTPLDIPANGSIQKQFSIRVNPLLQGSEPGTLKVKFNNEVNVSLVGAKTSTKSTVAGHTTQNYTAPASGASENVVIILAVLVTLGVFLVRRFKLGIT
jgi:hypothetical protein